MNIILLSFFSSFFGWGVPAAGADSIFPHPPAPLSACGSISAGLCTFRGALPFSWVADPNSWLFPSAPGFTIAVDSARGVPARSATAQIFWSRCGVARCPWWARARWSTRLTARRSAHCLSFKLKLYHIIIKDDKKSSVFKKILNVICQRHNEHNYDYFNCYLLYRF